MDNVIVMIQNRQSYDTIEFFRIVSCGMENDVCSAEWEATRNVPSFVTFGKWSYYKPADSRQKD